MPAASTPDPSLDRHERSQAPISRLDSALAEVVQRIVDVAQPERIILFGSMARQQTLEDSDIDDQPFAPFFRVLKRISSWSSR